MDKVAFVFAGQGAQYPGMGKSLYSVSTAARAVFDMADSVRPGTSAQCFEGTAEELAQTENTQPCLFCVDLAAAGALEENGIKADFAAGFSLGEIPALAFSGILSDEETFRLVIKRGLLMGRAAKSREGSMAAVLKLSNEEVEELCKGYENVYPVNYNCPGQLVVAGDKAELEAFCGAVSEKRGRAKMLSVSGAFHTPFMESAALGLEEELKSYNLKKPSVEIYSNVTALPYGENAVELIVNQVKSPVRWQSIAENLIERGVDTFIEVGAGKTLSGLIKKINKDVCVLNVEDAESLENTIRIMKGSK